MAREKEDDIINNNEGGGEYKLVVLRSEDLQEVRSYDLSLSNIYVTISVLLLALAAIIFSLLAFTPLKKLVPGYGKIEVNEEFLQLVDAVDDLDEKVAAQEIYMDALRRLILPVGDTSVQAISELPELEVADVSPTPVTSPRSTAYTTQSEPSLPPREAIEGEGLWTLLAESPPRPPVEGVINSEFDPSIKHFGVDILAPSKTPIRAIMDGYVFSSGWDLETGYTIGVQHKGQLLSFYKHNSLLLKEKGTFVRAGEAVAIIGNTGTLSSGPHLHFELWHNGKPINPKNIINFN